MQQAAQTLDVSEMVVRRLISEKTLPARQIVKFAPWTITRTDLDLPAVRRRIRLVLIGRRFPLINSANTQAPMFTDPSEV